jgi:hypothetical protein
MRYKRKSISKVFEKLRNIAPVTGKFSLLLFIIYFSLKLAWVPRFQKVVHAFTHTRTITRIAAKFIPLWGFCYSLKFLGFLELILIVPKICFY